MRAIVNMLAGIGVGAGLAYFLDSKSGRRRRALVRDQIVHAKHKLSDRGEAKLRHLRNRAKGTVAEVRGSLKGIGGAYPGSADDGRSATRPMPHASASHS